MTTVIYDTAGTFSWTCPPGYYSGDSLVTECWGGGGGGGCAGAVLQGGGGGGGAYSSKTLNPTIGTAYDVVVGAAGVGEEADGSPDATAGGDSYFSSAATVEAHGGAGAGLAVHRPWLVPMDGEAKSFSHSWRERQ